MDDDLDTPRAMAVVFDTVTRANASLDADGAEAPALVAAVFAMAGAVGLELQALPADVPPDVEAQVGALDAARAAKDFATADALRAALQAEGWVVETSKQGTTVRRA
jgi:cysteinyl-tRNA synthetase